LIGSFLEKVIEKTTEAAENHIDVIQTILEREMYPYRIPNAIRIIIKVKSKRIYRLTS
jgi:hypothetical protein